MNVENFDFESALEQGFKDLFASAGLDVIVSDDIDNEITEEAILFSVNANSPVGDHLNSEGNYDLYSGILEVEVRTLRSNLTSPTNPAFKSRQTELIANSRKALEEIDQSKIASYWGGAIAPTIVKPSNTFRDVDSQFRYTRLSYEIQFRVA
jgi:hypothetical protein